MEPSRLGAGFGMAAALVAALAWTLVSLVARDLTAQFPSLSLNIIRCAGASVLLVPLALVFGDLTSLPHVSLFAWICLTLSVLTALGIGDTAFFESTKSLGLARAMTISTAGYPPIASVLALWWFDERITLSLALGSIVALAGLVLIVSESADGPPGPAEGEPRRRGLELAVIAAVAWAVSAALMKPPVREIDPLAIQAVRLPLSTLLLWATPWARGTARGLWARRHAVARRIAALSALTALSAVAFPRGPQVRGRLHRHGPVVGRAALRAADRVPRGRARDVARRHRRRAHGGGDRDPEPLTARRRDVTAPRGGAGHASLLACLPRPCRPRPGSPARGATACRP